MTNQVVGNNQLIKANGEVVERITNELLNTVLEKLIDDKTTFADAFMILHNLHKRGILNVAIAWEKIPGGPQKEKTFRMADMTFRKAMRDLRLG